MSDDEKRILTVLSKAKVPQKISEIAAESWKGKRSKGDTEEGTPISAYRRVVNGLRRLRVRSLVKSEEKTEKREDGKKGPGRTYSLYSLTAAGTKFVEAME